MLPKICFLQPARAAAVPNYCATRWPLNGGHYQRQSPLKGDEGGEGTFLGASSTLKHPHEGGEGGSRETRTGANPVAGNSLLDEVLRQLNEEPTKH
jgi:hypothetical protein